MSSASVSPPGHTDIRTDSWVDRLLPAAARPYARLARLDRPIGIWLLLFPCWWSIALAAPPGAWPDLGLMALFAVGAVVMRGAGCTVNDILDRDLDAQVERTRGRPLPSGQVSVRQAVAFLALQLAVGLVILLQLSALAIMLGVFSLLLVGTYPLMKRITWWPQAFLGLTFNWGALMGWAAVTGTLPTPAILLYAGGVLWTLGYDTIYAHQDKEDDARVGVKSSALRLGPASARWIFGFYMGALALWIAAMLPETNPLAVFVPLFLVGLTMLRQVGSWDPGDPASSLETFKAARAVGWLILLAAMAGTAADRPELHGPPSPHRPAEAIHGQP